MSQGREPQPVRKGRILGAVLFILGTAILLGVLAANTGATPELEAWSYTLGLAFAPLLQATGLALFLIGGWLIWRSGRPGD